MIKLSLIALFAISITLLFINPSAGYLLSKVRADNVIRNARIETSQRALPKNMFSDNDRKVKSEENKSILDLLKKIAITTLLTTSLLFTQNVEPSSAFNWFQKEIVVDTPNQGFQSRSGLKFFKLQDSDYGPTPKYGQLVSFDYWIYYAPRSNVVKGSELELVYHSGEPYLTKHGNGRTIKGLEEAIHTMHVGEKRRLYIPYDLHYSKTAMGPIPNDPRPRHRLDAIVNEIEAAHKSGQAEGQLIFDVRLLMIRDDEGDLGYYEDTTISPEETLKYMKSFVEYSKNNKDFKEKLLQREQEGQVKERIEIEGKKLKPSNAIDLLDENSDGNTNDTNN